MSTSNRVRRTTDNTSIIPGSAVASGTFVNPKDNFVHTTNRQEAINNLKFTFQPVAFAPKVDVIRVRANQLTHNVETDTGYDLPSRAIILDVFLNVITPETTATTKTVEVGLLASESGGDLDGFLDGVSLAAAGVVRPGAVFNSGSDWPASTLRGAFLANFTAGSGTDDRGVYVEKPHVADSVTAKSVSVKLANNAFSEAVFDIVIVYIELPTTVA